MVTLLLAAALPFMFCAAPATVASIRKPVDATHAGAGSISLASGASFEITKGDPGKPPSDGDTFVADLRKTDRVQLCYAPSQHFADAGPAARMAIAGNVRTADYVFTLSYLPKTAPASPWAGITFPVLAPSQFNGIALSPARKGIFVVTTHAPDRYRIEVDDAPGCNGANVCSEGAFSGYGPAAIVNGHVTNPPDGDLIAPATSAPGDRPVTLRNGRTAFYSESPSGASDGGNSSLRWSQSGVLYVIESRISTEQKLVATANSAIRNGRVNTAAQR